MGEINDDDDALLRRPPRGKDTDIAKPDSSPLGEVRRGLLLLMECKAPDGRYLVTRKVHWQAVYRVLVDEGWYDASLGIRADAGCGGSAAGGDGGRKIEFSLQK